MAITFELPAEIEKKLREERGDANQAAKEAALVDLYRRQILSHSQFAEALGITRYEADGVLKAHGVYLEITIEDIRRELDGYEAAKLK